MTTRDSIKTYCMHYLTETDACSMEITRHFNTEQGTHIDWHEFSSALDQLHSENLIEIAYHERDGMAVYHRITRTIKTIASEINQDWANPHFGAVPYLRAMAWLNSIDDEYGFDDARSIINYFLANATTWRGETARRIKAELRGLVS